MPFSHNMKVWFFGEDKNGTSSAATLRRLRALWPVNRNVYSFGSGCRSVGRLSPGVAIQLGMSIGTVIILTGAAVLLLWIPCASSRAWHPQ
jgi:ABC-type transporter Mla maintaining outer membrane lipid asymmetry permease subunit MlaE